MKRWLLVLVLVGCITFIFSGCTSIRELKPASGPPGTCVQIKSGCLWGEPYRQTVLFDGRTVKNSFCGTFTVPENARPGRHSVTLIDDLDATEAWLIFPLFRLRHDSETFIVPGS